MRMTKDRWDRIIRNNAGEFPQKITNAWVDQVLLTLKTEQEGSQKWKDAETILRWGFCGRDLSGHDLSGLDKEHFGYLTFSSSTVFPSTEKMPKGIHPKDILERGTNPMLGIKKLHERGIDGSGVTIANIDSGWQSEKHPEYKETNIESVDLFNDNVEWHFHADGVLSNLCGQNLGVAPKANIIHYNTQIGNKDFTSQRVACLQDILKRVKSGEKIRAVNVSGPLVAIDRKVFREKTRELSSRDEKQKLFEEEENRLMEQWHFKPLLRELQSLGCEVVYSSRFWKDFSLCDFDHETNTIKPATWQGKEFLKPDNVAFVAGGKTIPDFPNETGYLYVQDAGASWAIPQAVGMYALALQQNPNLTWNQFAQISKSTSQMTESGVRVANPKEIIKQAGVMKTQETVIGDK